MSELSRILEEALALPAEERARLAASLISSLEPEEDPDVEQAWRAEVARRVEELDKGTAETVDWEEARRRILD
ncbi:MAG: addiction module protein [Pyrinomonadaceae bacterium]